VEPDLHPEDSCSGFTSFQNKASIGVEPYRKNRNELIWKYHTFVSVVKPQLVPSASHILDSYSAFSDIRHWMEKSQNYPYGQQLNYLEVIFKTCILFKHVYSL
jgi:hypothetical protein